MELPILVALGAGAFLLLRNKQTPVRQVPAELVPTTETASTEDAAVAERPAAQVAPLVVEVYRDDPGSSTYHVLLPETGIAYVVPYGALANIRGGNGIAALQADVDTWSATLYPTLAAEALAAAGKLAPTAYQNGPVSPEADRLFALSQQIATGTVNLRASGQTLGEFLRALEFADTTLLLQRLEGELRETFATLQAYQNLPPSRKTPSKDRDARRLLVLVREVEDKALPAVMDAAERGRPLADPKFVHAVLYGYVQMAPVLRKRIGGA